MSASETAKYFAKISKIIYCLGSPSIFTVNASRQALINKIHKTCANILDTLAVVLCINEICATFTQKYLTPKQKSNNEIFAVAHPLLYAYLFNAKYNQEGIRDLLKKLLIDLKETYFDENIGKVMLKKIKIWTACLLLVYFQAIILYAFESLMQVISNGATFTAIITVWPDIYDTTALATICRMFTYLVYLVFVSKVCSAYVVVISITLCLSHQYMTLQSYFRNLAKIFKEPLSQEEKERKYLTAFRDGIVLHRQTMQCTRQCQKTFNITFTSQVIINVSVLTQMMIQMVNTQRSLVALFSTIFGISSVLFCTGVVMLNAGDITVEASKVATAMYQSGWENCGKSTVRMRKLLVCAMIQAQQPELLMAFGFIPLSYESFLTIVKWSYSIFSVLY